MMWLLVCSQHYGKTRGTTPKVKGNLSLIFGRSTASSSIKEHFVLPLSTFPCRAPMKLQSHDEFYPNDMHWGVHTLQDRVCSTLSKPFWTFLPHKIPWNNFQVSETPAETNLLLVSKKRKISGVMQLALPSGVDTHHQMGGAVCHSSKNPYQPLEEF